MFLLSFYRRNTQNCVPYGYETLREFTDKLSFLAIMAVEVLSATMISVIKQELKLAKTGRA